MDFEKPEELKMVQTAVRQFVKEQLKPLERILLGRTADISDAVMCLPAEKERELIGIAEEMGLWGIGVPVNCRRRDAAEPIRAAAIDALPPGALIRCDSSMMNTDSCPASSMSRSSTFSGSRQNAS